MYTEDDTMTPRERISDEMLRKMLDGECKNDNGCGCSNHSEHSISHGMNTPINGSMGLKGYPLAMVYSPIQEFRSIYDKENALIKGTIFSELDLPFMGASVGNQGGQCK